MRRQGYPVIWISSGDLGGLSCRFRPQLPRAPSFVAERISDREPLLFDPDRVQAALNEQTVWAIGIV